MNPEVFYLHLHGEQRGPYTVPQIDHLLNSGLIHEETLYWREGLEQWQPVTTLVVRRERPNPWIKPAIALGCLLVFAVLARFFGPIAVVGWRETNQDDFTGRAAYWRARDVVRHSPVVGSALVEFHDLNHAQVTLHPPNAATVLLRGELIDAAGKSREALWRVAMKFNPPIRDWSGVSAEEVAAAP